MILSSLLALSLATSLETPISEKGCEDHSEPTACPFGGYAIFESEACELECESEQVPPPAPRLVCDFAWGAWRCEIWPQGPGMQYEVKGFGSLSVAKPSIQGLFNTPFVTTECSSEGFYGGLIVLVRSPAGLISSAKIPFNCAVLPQ